MGRNATATEKNVHIEVSAPDKLKQLKNEEKGALDTTQQLEKEEKETLDKLGKHILTINAIVKDARKIHKTIQDSITAAVVYYQRVQECREALILARGADARSTNTDSQKVAPSSKSDRGTQTTLEVERSGKQGTEGKKRNARSPLEPTREEKRVRRNAIPVVRQLSTQLSEIENQLETETEMETDDWKKVETREEKRRRRKEDGREAMSSQTKQMRRLPEAVAVKIKSLSYLDALRSIKSKIDPDKLRVTVSGIRQTRGGEILIEIKKGSGGAEELRSSLVDALGHQFNLILVTSGNAAYNQQQEHDKIGFYSVLSF